MPPLARTLWSAGAVLLVWAGVATASPTTTEPRLMLPGWHTVRAGQLLALRWSPADSVSELEILLSTDGGRHYSHCISPRLDPRRCRFVWRVPDMGDAA